MKTIINVYGFEAVVKDIMEKTAVGYEYIPNTARQSGDWFYLEMKEPNIQQEALNEPTKEETQPVVAEEKEKPVEEPTAPLNNVEDIVMSFTSKAKLAEYVKEMTGEDINTKNVSLSRLKEQVMNNLTL